VRRRAHVAQADEQGKGRNIAAFKQMRAAGHGVSIAALCGGRAALYWREILPGLRRSPSCPNAAPTSAIYRVDCHDDHHCGGDHVPGDGAGQLLSRQRHFGCCANCAAWTTTPATCCTRWARNQPGRLPRAPAQVDALARYLAALTPEMSRGSEQVVSLKGGRVVPRRAAPGAGSVLAIRMTLLPAWSVSRCTASMALATSRCFRSAAGCRPPDHRAPRDAGADGRTRRPRGG
jgi:hypothetical protein